MSEFFNREVKYEVIKIADIPKYLTNEETEQLDKLIARISDGRKKDRKRDNTYVVINEEEPYADIVWNLIELGENAKKGFWQKRDFS
jgi:uncharacterized protein YbbC (DUF1343 family)